MDEEDFDAHLRGKDGRNWKVAFHGTSTTSSLEIIKKCDSGASAFNVTDDPMQSCLDKMQKYKVTPEDLIQYPNHQRQLQPRNSDFHSSGALRVPCICLTSTRFDDADAPPASTCTNPARWGGDHYSKAKHCAYGFPRSHWKSMATAQMRTEMEKTHQPVMKNVRVGEYVSRCGMGPSGAVLMLLYDAKYALAYADNGVNAEVCGSWTFKAVGSHQTCLL